MILAAAATRTESGRLCRSAERRLVRRPTQPRCQADSHKPRRVPVTSPTGTFHGLFVGINRYQSVYVRNLASAVRDAQALHALFTDNLQGDTALVTDAEATSD